MKITQTQIEKLSPTSQKTFFLLDSDRNVKIKNKDTYLSVKNVLNLLEELPFFFEFQFIYNYEEIKNANEEERKDWLSILLHFFNQSPQNTLINHRTYSDIGKAMNLLASPIQFKGVEYSKEDIRLLAHCSLVKGFIDFVSFKTRQTRQPNYFCSMMDFPQCSMMGFIPPHFTPPQLEEIFTSQFTKTDSVLKQDIKAEFEKMRGQMCEVKETEATENKEPLQQWIALAKKFKEQRPKDINNQLAKKLEDLAEAEYGFALDFELFEKFLMSELSDYLLKKPTYKSIYLFACLREPFFAIEFEHCREELEERVKELLDETEKNNYKKLYESGISTYIELFNILSDKDTSNRYLKRLVDTILTIKEPLDFQGYLFYDYDETTFERINPSYPVKRFKEPPAIIKVFIKNIHSVLEKGNVGYDLLFDIKDDFLFTLCVLKFAETLPLTDVLFKEIDNRKNLPFMDAVRELNSHAFHIFKRHNGRDLFGCFNDLDKLLFLRKELNVIQSYKNNTVDPFDTSGLYLLNNEEKERLFNLIDCNTKAENALSIFKTVCKNDHTRLFLLFNEMIEWNNFTFLDLVNDFESWEKVILDYSKNSSIAKKYSVIWLSKVANKDNRYLGLIDKILA